MSADVWRPRCVDFKAHIWRAAHPNSFGQRDIANAVEAQLGSL